MRQNFSEPIVSQAFYNKYSRKCGCFVIILKQTSQQIQLYVYVTTWNYRNNFICNGMKTLGKCCMTI